MTTPTRPADTRPAGGRPPRLPAGYRHHYLWLTAEWQLVTAAADPPRRDPHRVDPRRDRQPDKPDDRDQGRRDGQRDRPRLAGPGSDPTPQPPPDPDWIRPTATDPWPSEPPTPGNPPRWLQRTILAAGVGLYACLLVGLALLGGAS